MMINVCSSCGISGAEIEEVSKQMGMAFQEITGAYQNHVFHYEKCDNNWIRISEKEQIS